MNKYQVGTYHLDEAIESDYIGYQIKQLNKHLLKIELGNQFDNQIETIYLMRFIKILRLTLDTSNLIKESYLIVSKQEVTLFNVLIYIEQNYKGQDPFILLIDGDSGSLKTTLANQLSYIFEGNIFHIDDYFIKPVITDDLFSKYGSNIDFETINQSVIQNINDKKDVLVRPFDFKTHTHLDYVKAPYKAFNIIEGAYSMHPFLNVKPNIRIFCEVDRKNQLKRILKRSGYRRLWQFIRKWIPKEKAYFKDLSIKEKADIIVNLKHHLR